MARLLPVPVGRSKDLLVVPHEARRLPTERPGFLDREAQEWIPETWRLLGPRLCPWHESCDFLLAPFPRPGPETAELIQRLDCLAEAYPVALYEREVAVLPNLLVPAVEQDAGESHTPAAGLRVFRSALRQRGRGTAEALVLLPARRLGYLLRGSPWAELKPGPSGSLQNRRFLVHALDYQRTLLMTWQVESGGELPSCRRLLVLAPHFDDESLACGGAVLRARQAGVEIRLVWLTDGARGVSGTPPLQAARLRHAEGREAAARLGVDDVHFLDAPETELSRRQPWRRILRRLIAEFQPERVHLPWWSDNHVDHYETNRLASAAWPASSRDVEIAAWGFWTPISQGRLLRLTDELTRDKEYVLAAHATQLAAVDYQRVARSLAWWHGRHLHPAQRAEVFFSMDAPSYWRMFRRSGAHRKWFWK